MEERMVNLRRDSGTGRRPLIALVGAMAIVLAACGPAATASPSTAASVPASEAAMLEHIPIRIGALIPQTGTLAGIGPALEQPLLMGAEEMNAVEDGLVTVDVADDGTDNTIAGQAVDQFLTGDHNGIIGPAASGVATAVWDEVNTANMVMCSGSSTGAIFSTEEYNPNHVRTAPSDNIQGPLLGNLILEDGNVDVAVVWRSDEYGVGFGEAVAAAIKESGGNVVMEEAYDKDATSFTPLAEEIAGSGAEALAMITFQEGGQLFLDLKSAGFDGQIYIADGFVDNVNEDVVPDLTQLEGIRGTYPSAAPSNGEATFGDRFAEFAPPDTPTVFSAHMYDCLAILTLAAQVAQSADPTVYVSEIIGVTRDGEKCEIIADCLEMVWAGTDIDYDGASGPLDFSPNGEPSLGVYNIVEYDAQGAVQSLEEIEGTLPS
jgi:ABC-type branched-subunit amino acid transport system substrate-binding protein